MKRFRTMVERLNAYMRILEKHIHSIAWGIYFEHFCYTGYGIICSGGNELCSITLYSQHVSHGHYGNLGRCYIFWVWIRD